jgi:parvulin-like peptidyl-prolyl isomerase
VRRFISTGIYLLLGGVFLCATPTLRSATGIEKSGGKIAIFTKQLQDRIRLACIFMGLDPNNTDNQKKVAPMVREALKNELLKRQLFQDMGIKIPEKQVEDAITQTEKGNKMPAGTFYKMLDHYTISRSALKDHFRTEILWSEYIKGRHGDELTVSPEEVNYHHKRLAQKAGKGPLPTKKQVEQQIRMQRFHLISQREFERLRNNQN